MKKTGALLSITLLAGVAFRAAVARPPAHPGKAVPSLVARASGTPQEAAKKQPQWKSNDEYNAFQAMAKEADPNKKVSDVEAFLKKFADSDFKDLAYVQMMGAYQQLNKGSEAMDAGHKALEANPDNLDALRFVSLALPYMFKTTDADATAQLTRAESDAKHGLEVLSKIQKPANVSEEQFNQAIKGVRAVFNDALGYVALQRKDYASAITHLKAGAEDNPSDNLTFSLLGQAYLYSSPPDYDNAIWNLARSVALAKAANSPNASELAKFYGQVYVSRHGSDAGQNDVVTQASTSVTPPAGFAVSPAERHKPTGNQAIDAFYNMEDNLRVGGDQEKQAWSQIKGQPFGFGGQVDSVEGGPDADTTLVHIDITDDSKAKDGVYDITLRDRQADSKYLSKGDLVRFQGTIADYTLTPSFSITLDGTINDDDLKAAAEAAKAKKAKRPPVRRRPH